MQNQVRIIGGKWRSRKINFPDLPELRPTHDRIRETLFNWLIPYINGANCLDLFAGSGSLGFEALSRGATRVTFVDNARKVITAIKENAELLNAVSLVETVLGECPKSIPPLVYSPFDIVFLDPPFHQNLVHQGLVWLEKMHYLEESALIYVEIEGELSISEIANGWNILKENNTASLNYALLQKR